MLFASAGAAGSVLGFDASWAANRPEYTAMTATIKNNPKHFIVLLIPDYLLVIKFLPL
jgi:hypothetical protein